MKIWFDKERFECVTTTIQLDAWDAKLSAARTICADSETTGLDTMSVALVGVSLAVQNDDTGEIEACYIPVGHTELACQGTEQLPIQYVLAMLKKHFEDAKKPKVFHNAAYDLVIFERYGLRVQNVHDSMYAAYTLEGRVDIGGLGMDHLAQKYMKYQTIKFSDVVLPKLGHQTFADVQLKHATVYAAEDTAVTLAIMRIFQKMLKSSDLWEVYTEIDRPLIPVMHSMKMAGARVDVDHIKKLNKVWSKRLEEIQRDIYKLSGQKFSLGSAQQMAKVLYDDLKLECLVYTESGAQSTGKEALEALDHPVVEAILEYRKLSKLISTYCTGLETKTDPKTGLVHTEFTTTVTKTGRFSSRNPNLQNIPVRTAEGKEIRKAFVAAKGEKLVICDYSQIELRIAAHVSGDPVLVRAYLENKDLHQLTASTVSGLPFDKVGKPERDVAKTANFLTLYGGGPGALAYQAKIELDAAYNFMFEHQKAHERFYDWKEELWEEARRDRFVVTPFGRRIWVPEITSKDRAKRGASERLAVSGVIQGGAGDLIRLAMARVHRDLDEKPKWRAKLFITCHDELLVRCKADYAEPCAALVQAGMETCWHGRVEFKVPITASADIGDSWADKT